MVPENASKPTSHTVELRERGASRNGEPQYLDRRLFVQLVALTAPSTPGPDVVAIQIATELRNQNVPGVIYADVHHPLGLAVVTFAENPDQLAGPFRATLADPRLPAGVQFRPELAMLGRTYSTGFEHDLEFWLLARPERTLLDERNRFAIWYPLRRLGPFERLDAKQKGAIMQEHGAIGRAYGELDLAHDIRLACHGLDPNDNDFVVGLLGPDLYPLSHVVQAMRRTVQTAEYMEKMGPFFVGRVLQRVMSR
jgi:hypothetical protein